LVKLGTRINGKWGGAPRRYSAFRDLPPMLKGLYPRSFFGGLVEWLMAADCKSAALRASEVQILHPPQILK
jgi:hypothetical protein